ncbi:site-specific recombinase XerD [Planktotalea frisia]|uniref:Phage integrase family protein n=1 Tax=Planktotalea frisia TaxID=696762 RepID=A0A1L9P0T8_9RHOB|nr:tyrosine-type recombinase/integrase [Planktotalea frisia]OJI95024.1 phage integrase family protein [Planktotalea frisia]PZX31573.1 site-specific recombinase XerD [Planktotalea frisia]
MRQLREDTHLILDGEVRVYQRERSKRWQASFNIDGHTIRISTGKRDLAEAKEYARDTFLEYKFRHKNDLPIVTKKFSDVAKLAIADMHKQLDAGLGRKVFADYIVCIERYLIPFFGAQFVTTIDYEKVQQFYEWRREKMGREPKASTLNTHNSAMNRVFEEAVARGFLAHKNVPLLVNKGEKSERRPDFTREEYATLIRKMPSWITKGKTGKPTDMRHLMRDYVLIMANTGMRHGTEALNLQWKHVTLFEEKDLQYLEMSVSGKTGRRDIICRSGTINYLKRIHERSEDIRHIQFEDLLKQRVDLPVFRLPDGTVSKNIHQTFRKFLTDTELITCPRTGQNRTLYSLRHTYATFALLNDGMDIHALAVQMGTSIGMIERHYSHLTPRLKKDMLTGKRYELSRDEFEEK